MNVTFDWLNFFLKTILINKSKMFWAKDDLEQIKDTFQQLHGRHMADCIDEECSAGCKNALVAIVQKA